MANLLNVNMLNIFIPSFVILILIATAVAILILCNEDDVESDKYHKARRVATMEQPKEKVDTYHDFGYYCASERCNKNTYKFINTLYDNFPNDFVVVPNVKVGRLISAFDKVENFDKKILNKTMDVGLFYRETMQPLVMIDLVCPESNDKSMQQANTDVLKAVSSLKIPAVEVVANDSYDEVKIKQELLKLMPANIKKKYSK